MGSLCDIECASKDGKARLLVTIGPTVRPTEIQNDSSASCIIRAGALSQVAFRCRVSRLLVLTVLCSLADYLAWSRNLVLWQPCADLLLEA